VNVLDKQTCTSSKECSPAWGLGEGLTTPHHIMLLCYSMLHKALDLDGNFGTV